MTESFGWNLNSQEAIEKEVPNGNPGCRVRNQWELGFG